jgi:hypothetical protein
MQNDYIFCIHHGNSVFCLLQYRFDKCRYSLQETKKITEEKVKLKQNCSCELTTKDGQNCRNLLYINGLKAIVIVFYM